MHWRGMSIPKASFLEQKEKEQQTSIFIRKPKDRTKQGLVCTTGGWATKTPEGIRYVNVAMLTWNCWVLRSSLLNSSSAKWVLFSPSSTTFAMQNLPFRFHLLSQFAVHLQNWKEKQKKTHRSIETETQSKETCIQINSWTNKEQSGLLTGKTQRKLINRRWNVPLLQSALLQLFHCYYQLQKRKKKVSLRTASRQREDINEHPNSSRKTEPALRSRELPSPASFTQQQHSLGSFQSKQAAKPKPSN